MQYPLQIYTRGTIGKQCLKKTPQNEKERRAESEIKKKKNTYHLAQVKIKLQISSRNSLISLKAIKCNLRVDRRRMVSDYYS